jgi:Tol biopolymer transport system component
VKTLGGGARDLVRSDAPLRTVLQGWTPDGSALLFTRSRAGQPNVALYTVTVQDGIVRSTGITSEWMREVSIHPDGSRVAFTTGSERYELWLAEHLHH